MKIQLIKEGKEIPRMSTLLNAIQNALSNEGYIVREVNHPEGFIRVNTDRGTMKNGQ